MKNFGKFFLSLIFAITVFGGAVLLPVSVSATNVDDNKGLVPCGATLNGKIDNPCNFDHFLILVSRITNYLIIIGAAVAALAFGWAGYLMMTAGGEMGKIEEAKAIFTKVLVGFLIMLSAWLIVHALEAGFLDTSVFHSFLS